MQKLEQEAKKWIEKSRENNNSKLEEVLENIKLNLCLLYLDFSFVSSLVNFVYLRSYISHPVVARYSIRYFLDMILK